VSAPLTAISQFDLPSASAASALPRATWNATTGVPSLKYSRQNGNAEATGLAPLCAQTVPKPRAAANARLAARSG